MPRDRIISTAANLFGIGAMILGMLIRRLSTFVLELDWNAGRGRTNYQVGNHQMLIRALIGS